MTLHLRLLVGALDVDPTDLLGDTYSLAVRRGLDLDGITDELAPEALAATVKGSDLVNPLANPDVRPTQPIRLLAGIEDTYGTDVTWHTIWTGSIDRNVIEHTATAKYDPDNYRVQLSAKDPIVPALAATPSTVAVSGTLAQRVAAVLAGTGIPYAVADPAPPAPLTWPLPTDQNTALGQLRLIRDTLHAVMFIDRDGVLQAVADGSRPRHATPPAPDHVATDEDPAPEGAILYHDITPIFDTDAVVNVLTIKTLTDDDDLEATYTDAESRDAWGPRRQEVTVNEGVAETHADLYLATRTDPDLIPDRLVFVVDPRADTYDAHLAAACSLEIGDTIDVTRLGRTHRLTVRELAHSITSTTDPVLRVLWTVEVGLRVPDVLPTRWDDVPADLTWDDVPADLTWDAAVHWRPYLEGA